MKKKYQSQNLKKDFIWNTIGSTINAFNSLFFMIFVTRINGVFDAGIFTFAFSTSAVFNIIGVYAGRVYQVTDNSKIRDYDYFINKGISCFIMLIVSIMFILMRNYNMQKSFIIMAFCIYRMLEAFSELWYAYFQKKLELFKVGFSLTIKNIINLIVFIVIDLLTKNILISAIGMIICYLIIMLVYDTKSINVKDLLKNKINWNNVFEIFKKGFFTFCLSFLTMYIINIPRYSIDSIMTDDFSTIFGILIMPASVITLMAQFILHPFIMKIANYIKKEDIFNMIKVIVKINLIVFLFGIFALIIAYLFGIPILSLIYSIDLNEYKLSLIIIMIGAIMNGITMILSNVLIAMRITFKQAVIYLVNTIIAIFISNYFVHVKGIFGACLSYFITMFLVLICFIFLMIYSINKKRKEYNNEEG